MTVLGVNYLRQLQLLCSNSLLPRNNSNIPFKLCLDSGFSYTFVVHIQHSAISAMLTCTFYVLDVLQSATCILRIQRSAVCVCVEYRDAILIVVLHFLVCFLSGMTCFAYLGIVTDELNKASPFGSLKTRTSLPQTSRIRSGRKGGDSVATRRSLVPLGLGDPGSNPIVADWRLIIRFAKSPGRSVGL